MGSGALRLALALMALAAAVRTPPAVAGTMESLARSRFLMGTRLSIEVTAANPGAAIEAAFAEVQRLDGILSNWRSDSELARLNRDAAREEVRCTEDLYGAVRAAIDWARRTDGAFDPTIDPLARWFGLRGPEGRLPGPGQAPAVVALSGPEAQDREAAARLVDWRRVRLQRRTRAIRFEQPGMSLDLGGIGKGEALDAALRVLRSHGVRSALLDFGGQLLAYGEGPDDGGFRVGVAPPDARDESAIALWLHDASLSTSGNSERGMPAGRGGAGHLIDPATGAPAGYRGSVTVMAHRGADADALSTALFVMGPERGLAWADRHGVDVLFLERDSAGRLKRRANGALRSILEEAGDAPVAN
jgi:thiamine biosynthesis lipoprotein